MILDLHHATDDKGAYGIDRDQEFHFGSRGYAGPGIYFAIDKKNAIAHAFNGKCKREPKAVTVVISCRVNLGKCLQTTPNPVGQEIMNQAKCVAKGCNSVNITATDTYAVYDSSRITILGFKSNRFQFIGLQPTMKVLRAVELFVAAIIASPEHCLTPGDLGQLYAQHPSLREDMGSKLQAFCDAHSELTWTAHGGVTLSKQQAGPTSSTASSSTASDSESEASPSERALQILVAAIKASPEHCLKPGDVGHLFTKNPGLRQEMGSKLKTFCAAHSELHWSLYGVRLSKHSPSQSGSSLSTHSSNPASDAESEPLSTELALKILVAAIRASPDSCLSAGALGQLYLKHPSLRDTLHKSGGLKLFCESHTDLSWSNEGLKEWGESRFARKEEKEEDKSAQKLKIEQAKALQQRQALAKQRLQKQDEEALQQRQVWDRQYRQELQLQIKLHEEQQGRQEKAVQQQKQALVQQKQMQQLKEEDEARRQRAWAVKFMEQHEARKEQEYYEARRQRKLEEERCQLSQREQRARMLRQQQRYMYAEQVRQNEEGLLVQCTPSSFVGALSFIVTAGLQVAAQGFRALFSSPEP